MMKITFADRGTMKALQRKLKDMPKAVREAGDAALLNEASLTMAEAQSTVPVVTGHLRSSGYVRVYKSKIDLGYSAPHAVYVHEIPYSGKTTRGLLGALRNGQGYKWLERAIIKISAGSGGRIAAAVRRAMRNL